MVDSSFSTTSSNKSRKPKLADDNESTDSLRREAAKLSDQAETPRKISKLQTTETDMQWRYLANSDKMLDPFNAVSFNSKKNYTMYKGRYKLFLKSLLAHLHRCLSCEVPYKN